MSEAMAMEHLLLKLWEFEGYWGRTRQRVPAKSTWPELDVVVRTRPVLSGSGSSS